MFSLLFYLKKSNKSEINVIESVKDGYSYHVKSGNDQYEALTILEDVRQRINYFEKYLQTNKKKYPEYEPYIKQLLERGTNIKLNENPPDGKLTSYTINKGEEMSLCLRSKRTGNLHDINLIMYVVIHELSHVACPEEQHTKLFKKIFIFFLHIAVQIGIYKPIPFDKHPLEYCGMMITENLLR
jgi:predicted metal-dependent hydrolase